MIPVAGSAYTYGYATLGELVAWIIGWDLMLEYMVGASLVAIGWSAYLVNLLNHLLEPFGWQLPKAWCNAPVGATPGILNLPAVLIVLVLTALLVRGIKESARVNLVMVVVKVAVILVFIAHHRLVRESRELATVHAVRLLGRHDRGRDRVSRLRRLRCGLDHGRGGAQPAARHADRHHRLARGRDGALRGRGLDHDRRRALHASSTWPIRWRWCSTC